jgi:hypothetical protein
VPEPALLISGINNLPVSGQIGPSDNYFGSSLFCSVNRIVNARYLFQKNTFIGRELHNMQGRHVKNYEFG